MELELDRTQLNAYTTVLDTVICREETLEMIVPDAYPDIARIYDTEAVAFLKTKEAAEGRAEVSGTVRAVILYVPDGEEGIRRIEANLPFNGAADRGGVGTDCTVVAQPRVVAAETRSLNPRKVLIRVNLEISVQVYVPVNEEISCGVCAAEEEHVEQMTEPCDTTVISSVQEKRFTYDDSLSLPGSRPEMEELLKPRVTLRCSDAKIIGSKLVFKGEAQLQILYRAVEGTLCTAEFELPFSQIMEVGDAGEEAACQMQVILTDAEVQMDSGEGRSISVTLELLAQAVIWEERTLTLLTDAYSTAAHVAAQMQEHVFHRLLDRGAKEQTVREMLETGILAREVSDAYVTVGTVSQRREGTHLILSAAASVTVLYCTEDGSSASVTSPLPLSCPLDLPENAICCCQCFPTAPVFAAGTTGGIEVRFSVVFQYAALESRKVLGIAALQAEENADQNTEDQPSIVLRMADGRERLWDIAKAYGTTTRDIMRANGLEEDTPFGAQMLLIPRKR